MGTLGLAMTPITDGAALVAALLCPLRSIAKPSCTLRRTTTNGALGAIRGTGCEAHDVTLDKGRRLKRWKP